MSSTPANKDCLDILMQGKASIPFFTPDGIKTTERWRSALSYGRRCHGSAGDGRFEQEITEQCISVTSAGSRYKTLNMTRKCALFLGGLPAFFFYYYFFLRKNGNIILGKYLN